MRTPPDVPMSYYRDYVELLYEYCAKATHDDVEIEPCPIFDK